MEKDDLGQFLSALEWMIENDLTDNLAKRIIKAIDQGGYGRCANRKMPRYLYEAILGKDLDRITGSLYKWEEDIRMDVMDEQNARGEVEEEEANRRVLNQVLLRETVAEVNKMYESKKPLSSFFPVGGYESTQMFDVWLG